MTATEAIARQQALPETVRRVRLRKALTGTVRFLISLAVLIGIWWVFAVVRNVPLLMPSPPEVMHAFGTLLGSGALVEDTLASLGRILSGLAIGAVGGVLLGLLLGSSRIVRGLLTPLVTLFRFVPPLAWYAPVLAWLGTGEESKIVLIVYTSIFVVAINTLSGMGETPVNARRMLRMSGSSWAQRFFLLDLPHALPYAITGIRIALGNAFMTVVTAEMLGSKVGLGALITNGMTTLSLPKVFVAILVLGVLGLIADRLFVWATNRFLRRFLPWTR